MLSSLKPLTLARRAVALTAALASLTVATACGDDDPAGPDDEPSVESVRLTVGGTTVTIDDRGNQSAPLAIRANQATAVSAVFLTASGQEDPIVTRTTEFVLNFENQGGVPLTFTRSATDRFAGTLTAAQTGSAVVEVQLFHTEENHDDFARNATISVTP